MDRDISQRKFCASRIDADMLPSLFGTGYLKQVWLLAVGSLCRSGLFFPTTRVYDSGIL